MRCEMGLSVVCGVCVSQINAGFRPVELDEGMMVRGEVQSCLGVVSLSILLPQQQETKSGSVVLVEATVTQRS